MLKLDDQLWIYTPASDRIIKISGHMLRQSVMGSDLSYEDFMTNERLEEDYEAVITGKDTVKGRPCWKLELNAVSTDASYFRQEIHVDQERFLVLKASRFARSGRLLKTTKIIEVFQKAGRWYPKRIVFKDELKQGKGTEFFIEDVEFDKKIPAYLFSKAALKR
jgi:outer membrane lipoprotein-sorting protein